MKTSHLLSTLLFAFPCLGNAMTYDCTLTYQIDRDQQPPEIETRQGLFEPDSTQPYLVLTFENRMRRNGTLNVENDGTVTLQIGDYCGDHYSLAKLPENPGPEISGTYSYGRDPVTNEWVTMTLECRRI